MGSEIIPVSFLKNLMHFIIDHKVCPKTPIEKWPVLLAYAYEKRYLYTLTEGEKITAVACLYRVPFWDEHFAKEMPEKESGTILYVNWVASSSKLQTSLLKMLRGYAKEHEVSELIYYKRGDNNDLKRINVERIKNEGRVSGITCVA